MRTQQLAKQILTEEKEDAALVAELLDAREHAQLAAQVLEELKKRLVSRARERAAGVGKSVEFVGPKDERLKVEFGSTTTYDTRLLEKVRAQIGVDAFEPLFTKKIEYQPTAKLRTFMRAQGGDAIKKIIASAQIVKPKAPSVRWPAASDEDEES